MNMKYSTILFSTLMIISAADLVAKDVSNEHLQISLSKCIEITAEDGRLLCYDNIAKSLSSAKEAVAAVKSPDLNLNKKSNTQADTASKVKIGTSIRQETKANTQVDDFGKKPETVSSSISSRLQGEFKSWKKGQKLKLENGQVWVVKRANSGYKKLQNPLITITEDFFGGFTAKIEGLNATAKVRRIK